jgi:YD repeat-containing protein
MKTIKRILMFLLIALPVCRYSKAQTPAFDTDQVMQMLSSDVATFAKYGDYSTNLYTGTPNISVPLYEINEAGIRVSLYLNYNATGLRPNNDAGVAGQNWTLVAGGMITRQIRGIPDDCFEYYPYNTTDRLSMFDTERYGYWAGIKQGYTPKSKEYLLDSINSYFKLKTTGSRRQLYCDIGFEHEPDIFTVSINGNSFRFMLDNNGTVKVFGNKAIKVDLSGLSIQNNDYPKSSTITVTMENGYRYVFGGDVSNLEIYYPTVEEAASADYYYIRTTRGIINAWYLTKIITPAGQDISFVYKPITDNELGKWKDGVDNVCVKKNIALSQGFGIHNELGKVGAIAQFASIAGGANVTNTYLGELFNRSCIKVVYLDSIKTPLSTIKFHYTPSTHNFYGNLNLISQSLIRKSIGRFQQNFPEKNYKLDSITVKNKNNVLVNNVKFKYKVIENNSSLCNVTPSSSRLFLDSVCINKNQRYGFQYHNTNNLVNPLTTSLDMEGFYNAGKGGILLSISPDPLQQNFNHRQANTNYTSNGLLKQITYPTGGYTKFEYERNDYGKRIEHKDNIKMTDCYDLNENLYAGGARIKKIIKSTGDTTVYSYTNNRQMKNLAYQSSGIYLQSYTYEYEYTSKLPNNNNQYDYYATASETAMYQSGAVSESAVGYTQVTEIQRNNGRNNGKTVYYFSNHETNPDILLANSIVIKTDKIESSKSEFTQQMDKFITYSDNALARGNLLCKEYYNEAGTLLQKETYKYNDSPDRFQDGVIGVNVGFTDGYGAGGVANAYASYYYPTELTEKQVCTYIGNNSIVETTNYIYNSKQQPIQTTTTNSDNKAMKTIYNYAWETNSDMLNKYILSPIGTQTDYVANSIVKILKNEYRTENGFPVLSKVYSGKSATTLETEVNYSKYDSKGNPLQKIGRDNVPVTYLWGYNQQYPIAEIKNLTYSEVIAKMSPFGVSESNINNVPIAAIHSYLRTEAFSNAQVTTYAYKPLVGVTSTTDPRGITTYYEYDSVGRLKTTYIGEKDANGNETKRVLKTYDYHYAD